MTHLSFDKRLYSKAALAESAQDFSHLAAFHIQEQDDRIEVTLENIDPDVADVLVEEFANHVLYGTIVRRKKW